MKTVVFLARSLQHYREPFHQLVREMLAARDVRYCLLHSAPTQSEQRKGDLWWPDWAEVVPIRHFGGERLGLVFQSAGAVSRDADLVVLGQHSKHLHNYGFILAGRFGRGFQAANPNGFGERFKRFWANKVDWWFAYTQSGAEAVAAARFPRDRITVFNNAIDMSAIAATLTGISEAERNAMRQLLVGGSHNVGLYVGGLYGLKRLDFLVEAARRVRALVPDFHLVVMGGGDDSAIIAEAAGAYDWIHAVGPKFGREKALLMSLGKVLLMPGLVGLAVLDAFAYGTPMVTTQLAYHSPEFDYLRPGENGVVVQDADSASAYALAVAAVLTEDETLARLRQGCAVAVRHYSIEAMAERFVDGVMAALEAGRR